MTLLCLPRREGANLRLRWIRTVCIFMMECTTNPNSSQAKLLVRRSLRDVSNVIKTSRQQLDPANPLARGRISFKIQPRRPAMGIYQPTWLSGAAALRHSVSTDGGCPREN